MDALIPTNVIAVDFRHKMIVTPVAAGNRPRVPPTGSRRPPRFGPALFVASGFYCVASSMTYAFVCWLASLALLLTRLL